MYSIVYYTVVLLLYDLWFQTARLIILIAVVSKQLQLYPSYMTEYRTQDCLVEGRHAIPLERIQDNLLKIIPYKNPGPIILCTVHCTVLYMDKLVRGLQVQ